MNKILNGLEKEDVKETLEEILEETLEETESEIVSELTKEVVLEDIQLLEEEINDKTTERESEFTEIKNMLSAIQTSFDDSIKYDKYKENLLDNLHKELTQYRNGIVEKIVETMAMDLIRMIDATKKSANIYNTKDYSENNYKRLLSLFEGVIEDLQDILYRQNIEAYTVVEDEVDIKKQKIVSIVDTTNKSLDNKVADRLAEGYEKNSKVMRPERISIYKYKEEKGENLNG